MEFEARVRTIVESQVDRLAESLQTATADDASRIVMTHLLETLPLHKPRPSALNNMAQLVCSIIKQRGIGTASNTIDNQGMTPSAHLTQVLPDTPPNNAGARPTSDVPVIPSTSWIDLRAMASMDPTLINALIVLRQKEVDADVKRVNAAIQCENIRANATIRCAELQYGQGVTTTMDPRKRKRNDDEAVDVDDILRRATLSYAGRPSLSAAVWRARPASGTADDDCTKVFDAVRRDAQAQRFAVPYTLRALARTDNVIVVYAAAGSDLDSLAAGFWARHHPHTLEDMPPDPEPVASQPEDEDEPPPPLEKVTVARMGRRIRMPTHATDLVDAVLSHMGRGLGPQRREWVAEITAPPRTACRGGALAPMLDHHFVRPHVREWGVLWAPRPKDPLVLPTYLDTARDPIVDQLKVWLRGGADPADAPLYPAEGVVDPRPPEPVPPALRALPSTAVWPLFERAGLAAACHDVMSAYQRSGGDAVGPPAAAAPHDERLRQWKRLTTDRPELRYAEIVDCLGWTDVRRDAALVHRLTEALMKADGPRETASWSGPYTFLFVENTGPDPGTRAAAARTTGAGRSASRRCDSPSCLWSDCAGAVPIYGGWPIGWCSERADFFLLRTSGTST